MSTSPAGNACGSLRGSGSPWRTGSEDSWWTQYRETSLNWLALGLLLAAWNASDNDAAAQVRPRPEALRGYSSVSVRAAHRTLSANCTPTTNLW